PPDAPAFQCYNFSRPIPGPYSEASEALIMSEENKRVLVVLAHPDDPEFFCGATLAKWARQGKEIDYLLLTCGDKGSDSPEVTPEMLCADRKVEQRAAADALGVREIKFLSFPDGELANSNQVRREIVREIRRKRPFAVVTSDPTAYIRANGINHPDHRAAGAATLDAVFPAAGNRMYFPELLSEGFEPFYPREIWLSIPNEPTEWVNVTDTIDVKLAALRAHKSQIKDMDALEKRIRERLRRPDVVGEFYAEAFRVIRFP
ncbi:MAG: PIG-L deacetylase family protein, partial [Rudaea sp.]